MKQKKPRKAAYKPTLVTSKLVPITDPAVLAAFDEMRHMENPVVPEILREHARALSRPKKAKPGQSKAKRG